MIRSMTGFGARTGEIGSLTWTADIRSVNGRGLDLKLRIPDWLEGLEGQLRSLLHSRLKRGNVTLNLKVSTSANVSELLRLNGRNLDQALDALVQVEQKAMDQGISLAPATATDILALRGVMEPEGKDDLDIKATVTALFQELTQVVDNFCKSRASEGEALENILRKQISEMTRLVERAKAELPDRDEKVKILLKQQVAKLLDTSQEIDETRLVQELALLGIKSDVSEELDRLETHIASAYELLDEEAAIGRRFDFLTQEFNREANTLCSKSQHSGLTTIGLAMKATIDQMREQVQNVE